jgi:2-amino-4-hydroxy-6-hydroxymethyldihydropteridine diphosphokinase
MATAHLLLGGNSGDRKHYIESAVQQIEESVGRIIDRSSLYESEPWGFTADTAFLNQVIRVETLLTPNETLTQLQIIEKKLGRLTRSGIYESRVIDIDILMFDDLNVHEKHLQIPHPRMHLRKFTLVPLAEIAGKVVHPLLNLDVDTLNRTCPDGLKVELYKEPSLAVPNPEDV